MKKILLVDDSKTLLMSMQSLAEKAGYGVETALDASLALNLLHHGCSPDLIITDLNMPGMDGIELIKEIRKLSAFRFKPILMLTTESERQIRLKAKSAGATGWLVKPVNAVKFYDVVNKVLPIAV